MRTSLFNTISLEDDVEIQADNTDTSMDVSKVIEDQEVNEELNEAQTEVDETMETMKESIEVVEELQDQVADQEAIIEQKPDEVTAETVQIAQEALQVKLAQLGMPLSDISTYRISAESIVSNPLQAFIVSTEGVKDVIKRIWEAIKNLFSKLIKGIKNLFTKVKNSGSMISEKYKKIINKLSGGDNVSNESSGIELTPEMLSPIAAIINECNGKFPTESDVIKCFSLLTDTSNCNVRGEFGKNIKSDDTIFHVKNIVDGGVNAVVYNDDGDTGIKNKFIKIDVNKINVDKSLKANSEKLYKTIYKKYAESTVFYKNIEKISNDTEKVLSGLDNYVDSMKNNESDNIDSVFDNAKSIIKQKMNIDLNKGEFVKMFEDKEVKLNTLLSTYSVTAGLITSCLSNYMYLLKAFASVGVVLGDACINEFTKKDK